MAVNSYNKNIEAEPERPATPASSRSINDNLHLQKPDGEGTIAAVILS